MKTINVDDNVWTRLSKLKYYYKTRSINKLIDAISKVIKKYKPEMDEELK